MNYVITGATSFLGVELAKSLIQQGNKVTAICRPNSHGLVNLPEGVEKVFAQMDEYGALDIKITQADVFVHLAWAGTGQNARNDFEIQQRNVENSLEAMRAATRMGCKLFVMSGSQAEYGSTLLQQREDMQCAPFSEYGKAKLQMWEEGCILAKELGLKYLHLRIFSLYGENDHPYTLVMTCMDKLSRNEPVELSSCTQNWNFLYVKEGATQINDLISYAIENDSFHCEIFNIASEDTRPLRLFVEEMKEVLHSTSDLRYGVYTPKQLVSLDPDTSKLRKAIGVSSHCSFKNVLLNWNKMS